MRVPKKTCQVEIPGKLYFTCNNCNGRFASNWSLKRHTYKCNQTYKCVECNKDFQTLKMQNKHMDKCHTKVECDYCSVSIAHPKNMKRHIRSKHKGLIATKEKAFKIKDKYQCDECLKGYFDKSTLNRHKKQHYLPCEICGDIFDGKSKLNSHVISHENEKIIKVPNITSHIIIQRKQVHWANELECVHEIPITKLPMNKQTIKSILYMFEEIDKIMLIFTNRNQCVTEEDLTKHYERSTKKVFDTIIFRALLSVYPESLIIELINKKLHIQIDASSKPVTPSKLVKRKDILVDKLDMLNDENALYIDLVKLPEDNKSSYKNAMEILDDNIVKLSDEEEDNFNEVEHNKLSAFERIKLKIKHNSFLKRKRELKIRCMDWQFKRLGTLARTINSIYFFEQKKVMKMDILLEKIRYRKYCLVSIKSDLNRLIENSNGWLTLFKDMVKINSDMNINSVCELLQDGSQFKN